MARMTGSNEDTQTEGAGLSEHPPRRASYFPPARREWAIRQYYGLPPGGDLIPSDETMTQQEIADRLGVTRQTVDRWVNSEPLPLFEDLSQRARQTLYACVMTGDMEAFEEYLDLLDELKEAGTAASSAVEAGEVEEDHLFGGLDGDANLW